MFGEALDPTTAEIAAAKNMRFAGLTPDGFGEMRLNVRLENWNGAATCHLVRAS
jgi:hypothetical protein